MEISVANPKNERKKEIYLFRAPSKYRKPAGIGMKVEGDDGPPNQQ